MEIKSSSKTVNASKTWLDKLYLNSIEYIINFKKHLKEYSVAILIVLFIRSTVGVVYQIPTGSMIPTFMIGDTLLANRFYYGLKIPFTDGKNGLRFPAVRELEVGDIAVFRGPQEEKFYDLTIDYHDKNQPLLRELNAKSTFKGIIDKNDYDILGTENNYIIVSHYQKLNEIAGNDLEIRIHEDLYHSYKNEIDKLIVNDVRSHIMVMTYRFQEQYSFFRQLINTPISGLSMIITVLARTPYLYGYAKMLGNFFPELINNQGRFSLYPNRYLDTTKEYVKRVIAKGGDVVEIRNKEVWVNGIKLAWSSEYQIDYNNEQFFLTIEDLPHSPKSTDRLFTHPIRFSRSIIKPNDSFDAVNWPYDVETRLASQFRDNFGPITVPEGHYFMMGDNRDESLDSRYIGPVPEAMISGTPMFIFLPWDRRGTVD